MKVIFKKNKIGSETIDRSLSLVRDGSSLISASAVSRNGQAHEIDWRNQHHYLQSGVTVKHRLNHRGSNWRNVLTECSYILGGNLRLESLSCFISPDEGHTPLHYDKSSVVVIQLSGIKRVGVQTYPAEKSPGADCLVKDQSQQMDAWFELHKGDLIYIPAGFVHATYTDELSYTLGAGFKNRGNVAK